MNGKVICLVWTQIVWTISISSFRGESCTLPTTDEDVDWDKMTGSWYQMLNPHAPLHSYARCVLLKDIQADPNGFHSSHEEYYPNSTKASIPVRLKRKNTGVYAIEKSLAAVSENPLIAVLKKNWKDLSPDVKEEASDIATHAEYHTSDYENYWIILFCGSRGEHYAYIHGRSSKPSVDAVLMVRNKLIDLGHGWENVKLYKSGCADITNWQDYKDE